MPRYRARWFAQKEITHVVRNKRGLALPWKLLGERFENIVIAALACLPVVIITVISLS